MYSDDEEAEIAVDIRRVWSAKVQSASRRDAPKPSPGSVRPKEPSVVATHYDPDRRRLYYGLDDGAVCFWSLSAESPPNANATRFVGCHKGAISAIATPRKSDGDLGKAGLIVTGSVDASIKIWDYQGKVMLDPTVCVQTLYGHTGTVTSLVLLGDYIVSSSTDGSVKMWRQGEGRQQLVYPWFELQVTVNGMEGWVRCMAHDSSGDVGDMGAIFAADESGGMTRIVPEAVWDDSIQRLSTRMEFKVESRVERLHDRGISIIRFVANWDLVLTVAYDQCIRAYDIKTGTVRHCWANERRCQFTTLEVNLEFDEILAGDTSGVLSIFSIRTGRLMVTKQLAKALQAAGSRAGSASSSANGGGNGGGGCPIVSITAVLERQLYAVVTARELALWRIEHELDYNIARGGHEKSVIALYTCSGGVAGAGGYQDYRVFSASLDNTVRLWDPYDMACIRVMEEGASEISAMTFYEGWNLVVTGHDNGDIRLWNLDTGAAVTLRQHANTVTALALALVHRNEELLLSGSYDGWLPPGAIAAGAGHAAADTLRRVLSAPEPEILALKFDPLKKVIVTAGTDKVIKVWAGTGYEYLGCHSGHKDAITCLALDSNFLFSGSDDCNICLWDTVPAGGSKAPYTGTRAQGAHSSSSSGVPPPPGGPSAPSPQQVSFKAAFSGRPLKTLVHHRRPVTGLDVLPSSGNLVSCSLDGQLLVWDYVAGQVLHRFAHDTEEFRCLALRYDRAEVLVGTQQASLLRYALHEPAVTPPGLGRGAGRGPGRPGSGGGGGGDEEEEEGGDSVNDELEGLALGGTDD
ncbi:hypothetical protein GPECTOR_61g810 [Gonium pectorale]|uniref:Anaphase-promoting complex subunit 4 WD40 domain-containing protein n=1 Tax=Gonium pectorale TaxID=33097 RepID=A0A150G4S8_GONPE|nr:hypothetical protein GPECTOR_61g810 [Gonium pectorale]|eukprot:KXZ44857.1 hypothetical protein GPECTOR_61g810 [Gonium pectorale]